VEILGLDCHFGFFGGVIVRVKYFPCRFLSLQHLVSITAALGRCCGSFVGGSLLSIDCLSHLPHSFSIILVQDRVHVFRALPFLDDLMEKGIIILLLLLVLGLRFLRAID